MSDDGFRKRQKRSPEVSRRNRDEDYYRSRNGDEEYYRRKSSSRHDYYDERSGEKSHRTEYHYYDSRSRASGGDRNRRERSYEHYPREVREDSYRLERESYDKRYSEDLLYRRHSSREPEGRSTRYGDEQRYRSRDSTDYREDDGYRTIQEDRVKSSEAVDYSSKFLPIDINDTKDKDSSVVSKIN